MLLTSSKANKMLKEYNEKLAELRQYEDMACTFVVSAGEDPDSVRPDYDFINIQRQIVNIEEDIVKLKHSINLFNVTTKLEGLDMTIDQALVVLPQLTTDKQRLERMVARLPKERCKTYNSNIVEYTYVNYDIEQAKKELENVRSQLSEIQLAINKANSMVEFEIF